MASVISIVLAVLTSLLASWFYFNPRTKNRLAYQMTSVLYFNETDYSLPPGAQMTFENTSVKRLTKTTVVLWNHGTETLYGTSIVIDDPLCVAFDEGDRIFSCRITQRTNDTNEAGIVGAAATHERLLSYDYLNAKDGFVVEIVHDSKKPHPLVSGSIKGVAKGVENFGLPRRSDMPGIGHYVMVLSSAAVVMGVVGPLTAGFTFVQSWAAEISPEWLRSLIADIAPVASVVFAVTVLLLIAGSAVFLWLRGRRRYPTKRLSI